MSTLNEAAFNKACIAYADSDGGWEERLKSAIETYMAEIFKPGELIVGEAIEPQRDYRKELWIAHWVSVPATTTYSKAVETSQRAVRAFDEFFGGAK